MGGIVPVGPPNHLSMLSDYIDAAERLVACPNQDVVYGLRCWRSTSPGGGPGARFRRAASGSTRSVDLRTDSFADFGKMYGTKPGFYLLVGPDWKGETPKGITKVFRATTNTGRS